MLGDVLNRQKGTKTNLSAVGHQSTNGAKREDRSFKKS